MLARFAVDRDIITDFQPGADQLQIDAALFGLSSGTSSLQPWQIIAAAGNPQASIAGVSTFLFNTTTGVLRYDVDGAGGQGAVHVATLQGVTGLSSSDFLII